MANYIKVDGANYKIQGRGALGGIATVQMPNIASDQTYTFPSIGGQLALEGENKLSAGVGDKPTVTDNLDGTLTVGNDGTYYLYSDATGESVIDAYTINGSTYTPADGMLSYLVANYNSGTPVLQVITNVSLINETTIIPVLTIYRDGTDLHLVDWDSLGWALTNKIHQSIVKTQRVRRESGLTLSEAATRKIIVSAGRVWIGAVPKDLSAADSSADPTTLYYHSSGNWTSTPVTAYDNTQYDNGTDLVTLSNNRYAVNFVYRCVSDTHGDHTYVVLGQGDYTLNEAQAAQPPNSLPPLISAMGILVGRIIVLKSAATATQIDSAFISTFSGTGAVDHNSTTGLQGGTAAEYYHLTSAQHTGLAALYAGTGTLTIPDNNLSIKGSSDATKIAKFEVDGFTTATTRTVTLPDANIVVAGSAAALTATRVPFVTTGGLLTDSANLTYASAQFYIADTTAATTTTSGALRVAGGIGVAGAGYFGGQIVGNAAPSATGTIYANPANVTTTSGTLATMRSNITMAAAAESSALGIAEWSISSVAPGNGQNYTSPFALVGVYGQASHNGTGTVARIHGVYGLATSTSSGTVTACSGLTTTVTNVGSGTITSGAGVRVLTNNNTGGGTFTNNYGIFVEAQTAGTNNWAIYTNAGRVRLGGDLETAAGRIEKLNTITTNTTLDATYHNVMCNSATAITVTLPAAASNSGRVYTIKNINTGTVTVDGNASETIDGATTYDLTLYQAIKILCNGTNWFII